MIAKIMKGGGFRGAADYLMRAGRNEPAGIIIAGNMVARDSRSIAAEFKISRQLRPDVSKPVWHASLALPPGQSLGDQDWDKAARVFMEEMGFDPAAHQWTAIRHDDREHQHIHILASRIRVTDGKLCRERRGDYKLSHAAARKAAAAVGVKPAGSSSPHTRQVTLRRGELAHAQRAGVPHPKLQIAARLDVALAHAVSLEQFQTVAAEYGVDVMFSINSGGIYGVSYRLADPAEREGFGVEWMKGSQVGKAYTISSITRRLAGELDTPTSRRSPRVRQDILQKLAREQLAGQEIVRWTNGYVAAVATSSEIRWRTGSAAEAAVCAALAREKGWAEMVLSDRGSDEKNRAAIEAYHRAGISVQLNGQRYPSPAASVTKQELKDGNDGRDPRTGQGGGGTAAPIPGAPEVDSGASERPAQKTQRHDAATRPAEPVLPVSAGADGKAAENDQRHRTSGQETSAQQGEEQVDLLDFLSDPVGTRERVQRALEDMSQANPGDHAARIIAEAHQVKAAEAIEEAIDPLDFLSEQGQPEQTAEPEPNPDPITAHEQAPVTHQPQPAPDPTPTGEDLRLAEDEAVARQAKYEGDMESTRPQTSAQIKGDLIAARQQREWHEMQSLIHRMKPSTIKAIASLRERESDLGTALALARKREAEARRQIRRDPAAMAAIHTRATGLARDRAERKKADELRRQVEKAKRELAQRQKEEEAKRQKEREEVKPSKKRKGKTEWKPS